MPSERDNAREWITAGVFCLLIAGLAWIPIVGQLFDHTTWPAFTIVTGIVMVTVGLVKRNWRANQ